MHYPLRRPWALVLRCERLGEKYMQAAMGPRHRSSDGLREAGHGVGYHSLRYGCEKSRRRDTDRFIPN